MLDLVKLNQGLSTTEILDRQHSDIKRKQEALRTAIVEGHGMEQIIQCSNKLIESTLEHFRSEEGAMNTSGFEGAAKHKLLHAEMTETVKTIWSSLERRKIHDAIELMKFFEGRLAYHLEIEDGTFEHAGHSAE